MTTIARPPGAVVRRHSPIPPDQLEADLLIGWEEQRVIRQRRVLQTLYRLLFTPPPAIPPSILPQFTTNQQLPFVNRVTEISEAAYPTLPRFPRAERSNAAHSHVTGDAESTSSGTSSSSFGFNIPELQKMSAETEDPNASKILRLEAYDQHITEIDRLFDPLTTKEDEYSDRFVFLCWGNATSCRVRGVKHFQYIMDHVLFWKRLQEAWFQARGEWRRKIPWYGIRNVKVVNVRLVGPVTDVPEEFHGTYQILDEQLEAKKKEYLQVVEEFQREHGNYDYDYYYDYDPNTCTYDQKLNQVNHSDLCPWVDEDWDGTVACDVQKRYVAQHQLNGLLMEPLRTSLFRNPKLALYNNLSNDNLVHLKRDVVFQYESGHFRGLGQLTFRALLVEDGWMLDASVGVICVPLAGIVSFLIVLLAWVIYRDWGIAWNVGSCVVPLLIGLASACPQARVPMT